MTRDSHSSVHDRPQLSPASRLPREERAPAPTARPASAPEHPLARMAERLARRRPENPGLEATFEALLREELEGERRLPTLGGASLRFARRSPRRRPEL
ncbi:MAG: hypothetical protein AB7N76_28775 [Planctomycetota bacterium]